MRDDSRPVVRPLAEAILEWSEPHLLEAVRAAEAAAPPGELESWGRDRIETISAPRTSAQTGRKNTLSGLPDTVAQADRAWNAVLEALRAKVEYGEISLRGRMVRPDRREDPEPLPSLWGPDLAFDIRGGTVFVRDQIFVAVMASRIPTKASERHVAPAAVGTEVGPSHPTGLSTRDHLSLLEAVTVWCDQRLVARVRDEERNFVAYELHQFPMPKLTHPTEWRQPTRRSWMVETDFTLLTAAWDVLTADFKTRIEQGGLYLEGVLSSEDPDAQPEAIPNSWAAELMFDLKANVVERRARRYLAVTVSKRPSAWIPVARQDPPGAPGGQPLRADQIRVLSDEEVLELLEDHARRVVENEAPMMPPGKISLIPIIRRKLEHRAANGLLAASVSEEAAVLEGWIADRLPSHQTPKAGTIENTLRKDYAALKARSNGTKP